MKRAAKKVAAQVQAVALTWDGARSPVRALPPKARAFLKGKSTGTIPPSRQKISQLFAENHVYEIRICWVPQLKGGANVLSDPFSIASGKRLAFRSTKIIRFGDVLGVVYRK